ncbi:MAG: CHASE3 domain-containing protein, partial [Caldimonas sp.]
MSVFTVVKRNPVVFPLACLAVAAMLGISETSYWRSANTLTDLAEVGTARTSVQNLAQSMLDAETGQRGYLITNRKEYLLPYDRALRTIA